MPLLRFLPEATNIDFIGVRYYAFALDGLLLLISIWSIFFHGFNLGLDFTGGVEVQAKAPYTISRVAGGAPSAARSIRWASTTR
jgi:preprotein translocase subunit SecF